MSERSSQAHLFAEHENFPFRYIYNIPGWAKPYICQCEQFDYTGLKDSTLALAAPKTCATCNRYNVYFFFKCTVCDEHFFKDFQHPRFCRLRHYMCWECLNQEVDSNPDEICCDAVRWWYDRTHIVPPVGTRVRRFSSEELDAIIDKGFSIA